MCPVVKHYRFERGIWAIGFSQGGLFLRAVFEWYPNLTVSTLITFGLPHMGVLQLPLCADDRLGM